MSEEQPNPFNEDDFVGNDDHIDALKEALREAVGQLDRTMKKIRSESGSEDPMEPFAYDKSWEDLAKENDEVIAKFQEPA